MTLVRDPVLRGMREVAGLLFDDPGRLLASWETGATLARLDDGSWLLRFARSLPMRCELAPALPLVDVGGTLVGLPLDAAGIDGAVVRLRHGELVGHRVAEVVEPASLLDVSGWRVHEVVTPPTAPMAKRPPAAPRLAPVARPTAFDGRARLGAQPEPTERDRRRWRRLQGTPPPASVTTPQLGSGPLFDFLARRRHRKYLDELTRLFAQGAVDEALRKALPLGGEGNDRKARGVPGRRRQLRIDFQRGRGGVIGLEPGLRAELNQRYRAAFQRLEREGRILDAAFVLADLLDRADEACQFLEEHGEVRLAAELSEARSDDRAETVRLWWRAGERERAIAVARRHGAFAPAVQRLERSQYHEEGRRLRMEWMAHLLDAGDIVTAYDVGAELEGEAAAAMRGRLIDIGVEHGGRLRARMLARQLRAGQEAPHPELEALVSDPWARRDRHLLARELAAVKRSVDHPDPVRALARNLLAEPAGVHRTVVETVVVLAKDPALRTDLPPMASLPVDTPTVPEPLWVDVDRFDRGHVAVWDARLLAGGRVIVATDGAGVRILRPDGRTAVDFDVTAHWLVPSDAGTRVLALRRLSGDAVGVTALDVVERRMHVVGNVAATAWADSYDGAQWFVAAGRTLWMLDILAEGPVALWRSKDVRHPISEVRRDGNRVQLALPDGFLHYELPRLEPFTGIPNLSAFDDYSVELEGEDDGRIVVVRKVGIAAPIATVQLAGATRVVARFDDRSLVLADDLGRVEVVDLEAAASRLSLRIRV